MLDLFIAGGRVVAPWGVGLWDIGVHGGRIVSVAHPAAARPQAARTIDARGKLVVPGGIDAHVHTSHEMRSPSGEVHMTAGPRETSAAAIYGGTTTILDFAEWHRPEPIATSIERAEARWKDAYTDYAHHLFLRGDMTPEVLAQIAEAVRAGYPSFKIFTSDARPGSIVDGRFDRASAASRPPKGQMVRAGDSFVLMQELARAGGILMVHGEDDEVVMFEYERHSREGRTSLEHMPSVHSALSEELSFWRTLRVARNVEGAAVYFVHVTARSGVEAIAHARAHGQAAYGEVLHSALAFTSDVYARPDGALYHTYPALKTEADRDGLWSGLREGALNTIATDQTSVSKAFKLVRPTIFDATGGHDGVEPRLAIAYTEAVSKRGLSVERFVEVTSSNPAKLFGLYPRKGAIAPGSDADLVILDPSVRRSLRLADLHGTDFSIWDGWEIHAWPSVVVLRGAVAVEDGVLRTAPGHGVRLPRRLDPAVQAGPSVS